MSPSPVEERGFMLRAVALARQGLGATAPNPCVGAVLVRGSRIVAEGFHTRCGQAHAEVECLRAAAGLGVDPSACTLYVTLEPCNHHGKTPPCTQAILAAGVRKLVIGTRDPNPRVLGGGAGFLRECGLDVREGVAGEECRDLIADFLLWQNSARTYNFLKMASTLDGRIAASSGDSTWVSGPESRAAVHDLRGRVGAVLIGSGTFRTDNPRLTARPECGAPGPQPLAVVVGTHLPVADAPAHLLRERAGETIFWTSEAEAGSDAAGALTGLGCAVWGLPALADGSGLDFRPGFERLRTERGCYHTLCEGGGQLAMSLVGQGLADEFHLYLAPKILGDATGVPVFAGRAVERMSQAVEWRMASHESCGADLRLILRPRREG